MLNEKTANLLSTNVFEKIETLGSSEDQNLPFAPGKLSIDVLDVSCTQSVNNPMGIMSYGHTEELFPVSKKTELKPNIIFDCTTPDFELCIQLIDKKKTSYDIAGQVKIKMVWAHNKTFNQKFKLFSLKNKSSGEINLAITFRKLELNKKLTPDDFEILKVIGKGSFGKVLQVRKKDTKRLYAMKTLSKRHLIERKEVDHTRSERTILAQNSCCPFLVGLKFSFQTTTKVYFVLEYINGGELFFHLQKEGSFSEERARFYASQLVLAVEHLHKQNVIYRDLKPENILIDYTGYIALTDFGLCKEHIKQGDTTNTFCGTPEYMAPEILLQKGYGPAVDWWTIGILLYEMLVGLPPFYDENVNIMYQKIISDELIFPEDVSSPAKNLITGLLERDPTKRLGSGEDGSTSIKAHEFFEPINWVELWNKRIIPTWRPVLMEETDTTNFDTNFTEMIPEDSIEKIAPIHNLQQNDFVGFTYVDGNEYLA